MLYQRLGCWSGMAHHTFVGTCLPQEAQSAVQIQPGDKKMLEGLQVPPKDWRTNQVIHGL